MAAALDNEDFSSALTNRTTLSEILSHNLGTGWCYFLTDIADCASEYSKIVNFVNFESPIDGTDLLLHTFCVTTVVTFSVDTSQDSFWDRETSFDIIEKLGPDPEQVDRWVLRSNIGSLKPLLDNLRNTRDRLNARGDSKRLDIAVKEEKDCFESQAKGETQMLHPDQDVYLLKIENSKDDDGLEGSGCSESIDPISENKYDNSRDYEDNYEDCAANEDSSMGGNESPEVEQAVERITSDLETPIDENRYKCEECHRFFKNPKGLEIHRMYAHRELSFKCCHCRWKFRSGHGLSRHMRIQHSDILADGNEKYECGQCSLSFTSTPEWRAHVKGIHDQVESKCPQCEKVLKNRKSLSAHRWLTHGKGKEKYLAASAEDGKAHRCPDCTKVFASEYKLTVHIRMVHTVEDAQCDQCPKKCKNRYYLNSHKWYFHGGGKERPRVEKVDFGIFQCEKCSKVYYNKRALRQHKNAQHTLRNKLKIKEKKLVPESERTCHLCQKVLLCKKSLAQHRRYVHSESTDFRCQVCALSFNCSSKLNAHMMQHTGELDCPFCEKTFKWKHSLTDHIRAHKGVRPYKCSYCADDFIDNRALKKHSLKVHGQETKGGISKDLNLEIIRTAHIKEKFNQSKRPRGRPATSTDV